MRHFVGAIALSFAVAGIAEAGLVLESRDSEAVVFGDYSVTNTVGNNVNGTLPIPVQSIHNSDFNSFMSGVISKSYVVNAAASNPRNMGLSLTGQVSMSDNRILAADGTSTAGFRAGGSLTGSGLITVPNPQSAAGAAGGSVNPNALSTWTFTIDSTYRYWVKGGANVSTYSAFSDGNSGAFGAYELGNYVNGTYTKIEGLESTSSNLTPTYEKAGELAPGKYTVTFRGAAGGFVQRPAYNQGIGSFNVNMLFNASFSLAQLTAPVAVVGVEANAPYSSIKVTPADTSTSAALVGGTASAITDVKLAVRSDLSEPAILGKPVELSGTGSDKFVLEVAYDPALVNPGADVELGWKNEQGEWVSAILGNSGGTSLFVDGAYNASLYTTLGTYGIDRDKHTVWAILDHNSEFGVLAVPEPATVGLLAVGLLLVGRRARRRA